MRKPPDRAAWEDAPPARGEPDRPIAAFDFDGTLTTHDSFTAFLRWKSGALGWAIGLLRLVPSLMLYLLKRDRGRLKSASVRVFLEGSPRAALAGEAERFASIHAARLFRPDALRAWAAHAANGDLRVIVTASPEEVVAPFARRLQADVLIASRLAWTPQDRVGPGLEGPNCRGPEKVRRLQQRFGPQVRLGSAYGDTSGDREMLALAAAGGMKVFTAAP